MQGILEDILGKDTFITNASVLPIAQGLASIVSRDMQNIRGISIRGRSELPSEFLKKNKVNIIAELKEAILQTPSIDPEIREYIQSKNSTIHEVTRFLDDNPDLKKAIHNMLDKSVGQKGAITTEIPSIAQHVSEVVQPLMEDESMKTEMTRLLQDDEYIRHLMPKLHEVIYTDKSINENLRLVAGSRMLQSFAEMLGENDVRYIGAIKDMKKLETLLNGMEVYAQDPSALRYLSKIKDAKHIKELIDEFSNGDGSYPYSTVEECAKSNGIDKKLTVDRDVEMHITVSAAKDIASSIEDFIPRQAITQKGSKNLAMAQVLEQLRKTTKQIPAITEHDEVQKLRAKKEHAVRTQH